MRLLAVDPSVRSCGVATFTDDGLLIHATRITSDMGTSEEIGLRCIAMAAKIRRGLAAVRFEPEAIVWEWPKIYTVGKSKGDPNDLVPMAAVGTSLATMLISSVNHIFTPEPHDWIGSIPKQCPKCKRTPGARTCKVCQGSAWRTPRGSLIELSLHEHERGRVPDQHDAIDAVGIGLWKLKRLALRRVFPGAV